MLNRYHILYIEPTSWDRAANYKIIDAIIVLCSCSVKELEKDFADLQLELKELEREVDYHQSQQRSGSGGSDPDDLFLPTTEGFVSSTRSKFERFEELIGEMKRKFEETLVYFGEDPKDSGAPTVEELFGNFSAFLQSFAVSLRARVTVL